MKIEDQVCSLELAKRLKELGVKQDSLFYWYYALHNGINVEWKIMSGIFGLMPDRYSAFTVAELINMYRELIQYDIIISKDINFIANFLAEKIIGIYETCCKKN